MLTISELARFAGVTVRAVRHYHARGLLPEPERDGSGYRRYDARAVVDLIRIRTLANAGIPLSRVHELLHADADEFARAVAEIDRDLRKEIRRLQLHRTQVALLTSGDGIALPDVVVEFLQRLRALGLSERMVEMERDGWIMVAARARRTWCPSGWRTGWQRWTTPGSSTSTAAAMRPSAGPPTTLHGQPAGLPDHPGLPGLAAAR